MRRPARLAALAALAVAAVVVVLLIGRCRSSHRAASKDRAATSPTERVAPPAPGAPRPVRVSEPLTLSAATAERAPGAAAGRFAGRVLDWGSGAPVAGAELAIAAVDGDAVSSFTSGADGTFEIEPPAPGRYHVVSALAAGYLPWAPEPGTSPLELVARPDVKVSGVIVYLVPAVDYHGHVVTSDGAPVGGATVTLLDAAAGERAGAPIDDTFTSAADGTFTFHAPDGALLEARADGFAPGRARLDAAAAVSHELTITLGARGGAAPADLKIAGVVVDEDGAPVAGARLTAEHEGIGRQDETWRTGVARSGADGRFEIGGLDSGEHAVLAVARGLAGDAVRAEAGATDVRVVLARGAQLRGRVMDAEGAPVPAATVVVMVPAGLVKQPVAVTSYFDAEGRFVIDGLTDDTPYLVVAQAHGWAPAAETPAKTGEEVTVTLRRGATLVGTMTDAVSHEPLAGGKVTIEGAIGDGNSAIPLLTTAITRDDGGFELAGMAPGRHSVTAGAYAHDMQLVGPFDIAEGQRLGPIAIELPPVKPGEAPKLELAGIGAALTAQGDVLLVERVIEGGGAEAAGLLAGDHVLAVDGTPITALGLDGAIQHIRGPVGTQVVLRIQRADAAPTDLAVTRTKIRT